MHCKKRVFRNPKSGGHPPATTFCASKHSISVFRIVTLSIWRCYAVLDWVFGSTRSRLERCYASLDLVFRNTGGLTVVLCNLELSVSKHF